MVSSCGNSCDNVKIIQGIKLLCTLENNASAVKSGWGYKLLKGLIQSSQDGFVLLLYCYLAYISRLAVIEYIEDFCISSPSHATGVSINTRVLFYGMFRYIVQMLYDSGMFCVLYL